LYFVIIYMSATTNTNSKKSLPAEPQNNHSSNSTTANFWKTNKLAALILFVLAIALYAYTASSGFEYALDDQLYITKNDFTKKGLKGIPDILTKESFVGFWGEQKDLLEGARYRPMVITTFALEYQFLGENPRFSHAVNVLLYALLGLLLFRLLSLMWQTSHFSDSLNNKWYLAVPFVATALFIAHPVHTEVAANIKGRMEILELLGCLGAMWFAFKYAAKTNSGNSTTFNIRMITGLALCYFGALMTKESAIAFLAIVPISLWVFRPQTKLNKQIIIVAGTMFGAFAVFMLVRFMAIGFFWNSGGQKITELLNNPFAEATKSQEYATIFYTLWIYLKLLIAPLTLTHDYYPKQIPILNWSDYRAFLPLLFYLVLSGLAVWGLLRRKIWAWCWAFYGLSLIIVSNLLFPVGTFLNERFLFIPAIGFCVLVAWILVQKLPKWQPKIAHTAPVLLLGLLLATYSLRTWARLPAWRSNETLFLTDVENSPNSSKVNTAAGGVLLEKAAKITNNKDDQKIMRQRAVAYLEKALKIYPDNHNAQLLLGNAYLEMGEFQKAFPPYLQLLERNPNHELVNSNLVTVAEQITEVHAIADLAEFIEQKVLPLNNGRYQPYHALGILYGKKMNKLEKAAEFLAKAVELPNASAAAWQDYMTAYGMMGNFEKALEIGLKAEQKYPQYEPILRNIAISYANLKQMDKANAYFKRADMALNKK
jgi:tetratricopeptide (TPR) repeat protein